MCLSVNNCCCCITLEVGSKIISILCTFSAIVSILVYGSAAATAAGQDMPPGRLGFYMAMAVTSVLQLICGVLLIMGTYARRPNLTWPWTALTWFMSVALISIAVTGAVLLGYNREADTTAEISAIISVYFVYALLMFYFASVVYSRRQQMVVEGRIEAAQRMMGHRVLPNYYV